MSIYEQITGAGQDFVDWRKRGGFTPQLHGILGEIGEAASYFLSPRGRQAAMNVAEVGDMVNPVAGVARSGQQFSEADYVGAMTEVAGILIPTAIVARFGPQTALAAGKAIQETLTGTGDSMAQVGADVYEAFIARMNQPGPAPDALGSNFGNIGHNGGPSLEPDEIIPPARPRYINEYSATYDAATKLPQERGTYEQMRKMMLDRGAKEDELIWSGFDSQFKDEGKVTKQGIMDYLVDTTGDSMIRRHTNQVDGIVDKDAFIDNDDLVSRYVEMNLNEETRHVLEEYRPELLRSGDHYQARYLGEDHLQVVADEFGYETTDEFLKYLDKEYEGLDTWMSPSSWGGGRKYPADYTIHKSEDDALDYVMDEDYAREMAEENLEEYTRSMDVVELREFMGMAETADVGESGVQFAEYFTPGAKNYAENRYTYEAPLSGVRSSDMDYRGAHHDEENIMVHTRTGEFPVHSEYGGAHHVGEIQSDWAQQLRRQAEKSAEYGKKYRARTFDEIEEYTKGQNSMQVMRGIINEATKVYSRNIDENPDLTRKINEFALSPMGKYHKTTNSIEKQQYLEKNVPISNQAILDYFMENQVNEPFAKAFRDENNGLYKKYRKLIDKAKSIAEEDAKEGGPIIESTNKWVDFALRRELVDAVASGKEFMTISNPEMVRDMTMGPVHGQSEFYGKIVPQRLKKLLRTFDKKANLEQIEIMTGNGPQKVLAVRLTDDFVKKMAGKGMPIFSIGAGGAGVLGALQMQGEGEERGGI
jgi:hypothetical protein